MQQLLDRRMCVGDALDRVARVLSVCSMTCSAFHSCLRCASELTSAPTRDTKIRCTPSVGAGRGRALAPHPGCRGFRRAARRRRGSSVEMPSRAAPTPLWESTFDAHLPVGDQVVVDRHHRACAVSPTPGDGREAVLHQAGQYCPANRAIGSAHQAHES